MKDSRSRYLAKNTAIFAIGNMGTRLINFIMVPLYTYALSAGEYGIINSISSVCSILIPIIMCNIGEAIRRYLLDKDADQYGIQTVEFIWFVISLVLTAILFVILQFIPAIQTYAKEMCLYIISNAFITTSLEYLRGREKLKLYTICGLFQTALVAALNILFLVKLRYGIKGYFWSYTTSYIICGLVAFIFGGQLKGFSNLHLDKLLFINMSKFALMLIPNSIMWWITNASDKLMVTYFVSTAATGIYSISAKLPTILTTMNTILMQAWQYSAIKESDSADKVNYNNKMFRLYVATISLVGSFLLLINRPFMSIYVSPEFREAWKYSPFLIVSSMISTLATFVGTSYYVEKDMAGNLKSATVGAAVNIILNFALIPWAGITGAAVATCLSYVAVLIFRIVDTKKYLPLQVDNKFVIKLVAIILYMLAVSFIPHPYNNFALAVGFVSVLWATKEYYSNIISNIIGQIFVKFRMGGKL